MIRIEHASGHVDVDSSPWRVAAALANTATPLPSGGSVMVGDNGWDAQTVALRCRVRRTTPAPLGDAAVGELEQLLTAARGATALHNLTPDKPHTLFIAGLSSARCRLHGTWWEVELVFLPRRLRGLRGTGEAVTIDGHAITVNGEKVMLEVA